MATVIYRAIQTSDPPPSPAKTGYASRQLSNAFSNAIYLDIIWKVSCTMIKLLGLSESFCKIDTINFWLIFTIFYQYQVFRLICSTKCLNFFRQLWPCFQMHPALVHVLYVNKCYLASIELMVKENSKFSKNLVKNRKK